MRQENDKFSLFIHALDGDSEKFIADMLGPKARMALYHRVKCGDQKERSMWLVGVEDMCTMVVNHGHIGVEAHFYVGRPGKLPQKINIKFPEDVQPRVWKEMLLDILQQMLGLSQRELERLTEPPSRDVDDQDSGRLLIPGDTNASVKHK